MKSILLSMISLMLGPNLFADTIVTYQLKSVVYEGVPVFNGIRCGNDRDALMDFISYKQGDKFIIFYGSCYRNIANVTLEPEIKTNLPAGHYKGNSFCATDDAEELKDLGFLVSTDKVVLIPNISSDKECDAKSDEKRRYKSIYFDIYIQ